jgi:signal transduction histidine kinase
MTPVLIKRIGVALAAVAGVVAIALGFDLLSASTALVASDLVYPVVAIGAGVLLIAGALTKTGSERVSWLLVGSGVVMLGLGELTWIWYELVLDSEPPFPGIPDFFYLAAYPALVVAMLVTPRLAANRYQRGQQLIDGVVITAGLAVVVWVLALGPMYRSAGEGSLAEFVVGAAYPVGDILVVAAAATIGIRRSWRLRDRSLWCVVIAVIVTAVGDLVYLMESWSDSYVSGSWVDATWLGAYGLFALAAVWLPDVTDRRRLSERRLPLAHVLIPGAVVLLIVGVYVGRKAIGGDSSGLPYEIGFTTLGMFVMARILLAVAEDRHLLDTERTQLVSVVSHELRTPLTAVQGYLDLVLGDWEDLSDRDRIEMVSIATEEAGLVTRIVTDLIATSRDSLHATELTIEPVDAGAVIPELAAIVVRRLQVEVEVAAGTLVAADKERFTQIITNLLSNADRYGSSRVMCRARRVNGHVEIGVHDDGPGVPRRYQDSVWDLFERGLHRFDASTPGSGLGLGIVRSLVSAHNGQVGYRTSSVLGGACFWVKLPAATTAMGDTTHAGTSSDSAMVLVEPF